jgi:hypothetical protein
MENLWVDMDGSNNVIAIYANKQYFGQSTMTDQDPAIIAFLNPPAPTTEERVDSAFPQTDMARVKFETIFEMANMIRAREDTVNGTTKGPITKVQLRTNLKNKLP